MTSASAEPKLENQLLKTQQAHFDIVLSTIDPVVRA